jgi:hypothetical protein
MHTIHPIFLSRPTALAVAGLFASFTAFSSPALAQSCDIKLMAIDGNGNEELGTAIELNGSMALGGAPGEASPAGDLRVGAVYAWTQTPLNSEWIYSAMLQPQSAVADDRFGSAIDADQFSVAIGAPGRPGTTATSEGRVYIYKTFDSGFNWQLEGSVTASDGQIGDQFGASVAISGDWMIVGAPGNDAAGNNRGAAYVYKRVSGIWIQNRKILPPSAIVSGQGFGSVVEMSDRLTLVGGDSLTANVTTSGVIAHYYRNTSGIFDFERIIEASDAAVADFFGQSIEFEDDVLVVGAPNDDDAANNAGAAYVFRYSQSSRRFQEEAKIVPQDAQVNDSVGSAVALRSGRVALGAKDRVGGGAAWTFTESGGAWSQERFVQPAELVGYGRGGTALALSAGRLLFSDPVDDTRAFNSGAMFVVDLAGIDMDGNGVADDCESVFTRYCDNAAPNSTGVPGTVSAAGSTLVDDQYLRLTAESLPQDSFGYFILSETQGFAANPGGSQGDICLGGTIGRLLAQVTSSGSDGAITIDFDMDALPNTLQPAVAPGDAWNFQLWYRDANPTATSNFTDAITVMFR